MFDIVHTQPANEFILTFGSHKKAFIMNQDTVEGRWKQFKGKVKAQWGKLTGSHVEVIEGKSVELSGKVQEGYGVAKDATEQQIEHLERRTKG
jgi:uncharacterized protein YjbJ (UPF0337 family)